MVSDFLPADLQQFVAQEVADGKYPSPDAVVAEAVRLLRDRQREAELDRFKTQLRERIDGLDRGEGLRVERDDLRAFFDDVVAEGDRRLATRKGIGQPERGE